MIKKILSLLAGIKRLVLLACQSVKDFLNVFLSCWLSLGMLGFGYYALHVNDQGRDVVTSLDSENFWLIGAVNVTLLFWAYEVWYSVRLNLLFTDFSHTKNERRVIFFQKFILILTALAPFIIFGWSIIKYNESSWNVLFYMFFFLFYAIGLYFRDKYIKIVNQPLSSMLWKEKGLRMGDSGVKVKTWQNFLRGKGFLEGEMSGEFDDKTADATAKYQKASDLPLGNQLNEETFNKAKGEGFESQAAQLTKQPISYWELSPVERFAFWIPAAAVLGFSLIFWKFPVKFAQWLTPLVVIFLAMGVWTGMLNYVIRMEKQYKIPAFFIIVALTCLFSFTNNNHTIRTVDPYSEKTSGSCEIGNHFCTWLNENQPDGTEKKIKKVVLVAGQGGGIRAAYWTSSILASLHEGIPEFEKKIYAISSVSGSSLGAAAYAASLYDQHNNGDTAGMLPHIRRFLSKDFLSPITAAFVFPDLLQRFFFKPVSSFDRARYLEYSWEEGWNECSTCNSNVFSRGFTSLWSGKNKYGIPSLFLNGTHAETGRKVITSNLSCSDLSFQSKDVIQIVGRDIPLSTAALLSARFPGLTPGALIPMGDSSWGNVVDGGYYDNSGVVTLLDLYKKLMRGCSANNSCDCNRDSVQFLALIIQNGTPPKEYVDPIAFVYETRTIPSAFINAYDVRPEQEMQELRSVMSCNGDMVVEINLPRNKMENLPLGWFLSSKSQGILNMYVDSFKVSKEMQVIKNFLSQ